MKLRQANTSLYYLLLLEELQIIMGLLTADSWRCKVVCNCLSSNTHLPNSLLFSGNSLGSSGSSYNLFSQFHHEFGGKIVAFASRKSTKKLKGNKNQQSEVKLESTKSTLDDYSGIKDESSSRSGEFAIVNEKKEVNSVTNAVPFRGAVLQACTVTSGLIAALGLAIRQVSQVASSGGLPVFDCSQVSFDFEVWHLELITGMVVLISMSRYTLLKIWPDFAESSEAANRQVKKSIKAAKNLLSVRTYLSLTNCSLPCLVLLMKVLTSLQPFDYLTIAFLPGISEEILFRGGLLPLLGLNWKSALAVAALFGVLHLGSGRKSSFAIWATFVGFAYGYTTIISSNLVVPMASHALNNLVGALIWRQTSKSSE